MREVRKAGLAAHKRSKVCKDRAHLLAATAVSYGVSYAI